jgi:single-strand DNA-binding protein
MLNVVVLIGRITKEITMRYTNSNVGVASFTLAVNRSYVGKDEIDVDFIPCVVWDRGKYKQAENCAKYLNKGSLVGIEGKIQTRNYEANDGTRRYITEVIADNVRFLDSKPKDDEHKQYVPSEVSDNMKVERDDPFFANSNIEIDDDAPF